MLTYVVGSLFESPAHTLVNTVNTEGVMGKGIAKRFKTVYPNMFEEYQRLCKRGQFAVGQLWIYRTPNKWVLNFPTKTTWRKPSKVEYIEQGLETFAATFSDRGIASVAFPMLGCGNGELDWETQVQPLMEDYLADLPIQIYIHTYQADPSEKPEHRKIREVNRWLRSEPRTLPFSEVWRDLKTTLVSDPALTTPGNVDQFQAYLAEGTVPGILIRAQSDTYFILREHLEAVWDVVRLGKFAVAETVQPYLDEAMPYLLGLFARLEYTRLTYVGSEYRRDTSAYNVGLQLASSAVRRTASFDRNRASTYSVEFQPIPANSGTLHTEVRQLELV
ncbi:MAG: macro domain-containing protein [Chloroflexi bacterium]|nr:macro domain-containing protein [Chloroflexota bacterium]